MTIYSNLDDAIRELYEMHAELGRQTVRIGTGETVDSLSLDPLLLYSNELISAFQNFPKWTLEFKSKSAYVDQFDQVPHAGNVICSWSVNPQYVISREEHETSSLQERIQAARKCRDRGFQISFHVDPMIYHPEWKKNYAELIETICQNFSPQEVPYMSVGTLRFQPEQRILMRERFGMNSLVTSAEVFPSQTDGKLRYDRSLRQEMYEFVLSQFRTQDPKWRIFMCMETPETWVQTTGQSPFKNSELEDLFTLRPVTDFNRFENNQPS